MAGIKNCIQDVLAKLIAIQVVNQDQSTVPLYARIWNNQVRYEREGKTYNYPKPAAFVEITSPATYEIIGQGYRNSDISIRIHLVHEFYDATDGTFEQDLIIFDLRDQILAVLSFFTPAGCGPMTCVTESQEYEHDNLYEYILDFVCNFTDSKGSPLDPSRAVYAPAVPPITLEVQEAISEGGGQVTQARTFLINKP